MDVRIGITQTPKEVEVELSDDDDRDKVLADMEKLLKTGDGVLWLPVVLEQLQAPDVHGVFTGFAEQKQGIGRCNQLH